MTRGNDGAVHKVNSAGENLGVFAEIEEREESERLERVVEAEIDATLASFMSTRAGRKTVAWILSLTGLDASVTSMNPMRMMAAAARRDIGLALKDRLISACPKQFIQMEQESYGRND